MERQGHLRNYPCTSPSSNPTLTLTSHSGQNVGLGQGGVSRWVVYQNLRLTRRTLEHQSHPNYSSSSCKLCTALSLWAYTGGATTIYLRKAYKIKHNKAKKVGGNRDWTSDLSICSRMLYHWAMPPVPIRLYNKSDIFGSLYFKVYLIVQVEVVYISIDSSWIIYFLSFATSSRLMLFNDLYNTIQ